jgi:hypothetical protein
MRYLALAATALLLASCSSGRWEPGGSFFDPLCMPDGSVVMYEYANSGGKYDEVTANRANCPWNKTKT